jgi:hypothetical protein
MELNFSTCGSCNGIELIFSILFTLFQCMSSILELIDKNNIYNEIQLFIFVATIFAIPHYFAIYCYSIHIIEQKHLTPKIFFCHIFAFVNEIGFICWAINIFNQNTTFWIIFIKQIIYLFMNFYRSISYCQKKNVLPIEIN